MSHKGMQVTIINRRSPSHMPYADSTRRQCLRGSITNLALRTATGLRRDLTIACSFPGHPLRLFLIERKKRLCKSFPPPVELRRTATASGRIISKCERLGKTIAQHPATVKLTLVRRAQRRRREHRLPELRAKAESVSTVSRRREPHWRRVVGSAPVAPVSSAYRFYSGRVSASLGSSERHASETSASARHHRRVSETVYRSEEHMSELQSR